MENNMASFNTLGKGRTVQERRTVHEASLWGDVFENAAKSGILSYLKKVEVLSDDLHPSLSQWTETKFKRVIKHFSNFYRRSHEESVQIGKTFLHHLTFIGWTTGYTVMREWWKKSELSRALAAKRIRVAGIWSPLEFPDRSVGQQDLTEIEKATAFADNRERRVNAFLSAFGISEGTLEDPITLARKGMPAQADFMLVLEDTKKPDRAYLVCMEFSLKTQSILKDFVNEDAHLDEVRSHVHSLSQRGVFSDLGAQFSDVDISISEDIPRFMTAFTGSDKPLYKLMQASSYATHMADLLSKYDTIYTTAIAMTNEGIESLSGVSNRNKPSSGTFSLMRALGRVYVTKTDQQENFEISLDDVFDTIVRGMPRVLRKPLENFLSSACADRRASAQIEETLDDYSRPTQRYSVDDAIRWLESSCESNKAIPLQDYLRPEALKNRLEACSRDGGVTIRDLNSAVIESTITNAPAGKITALGLLGHPGIGKTTSTIKALRNLNKTSGENSLFLYFSPRTVINEGVTQDVTKAAGPQDEGNVGAISLNTSHKLIGAVQDYAQKKGRDVRGRKPSSAVAYTCSFPVNGSVVSPVPFDGETSCLYLTLDDADEAMIHNKSPGGYRGYDHASSERHIKSQSQPSVMETLAQACRDVAIKNPDIPIIAGTAAIQGMRRSAKQAQATVSNLAAIFRKKHSRGVRESRGLRASIRHELINFAKHRPVVVVMVDELAGDGAGAPMAEAMAQCLYGALIKPFEGERESSPFRVILLLADASLSSPEAFKAFLSSAGTEESGGRNPPRILLSPRTSTSPFSLKNDGIRSLENIPFVTMVSADAYPATSLTLCYDLCLRDVDARTDPNLQTHKLIKKQFTDSDIIEAAGRITQELSKIPINQQVIYYAQDRKHLADIKSELVEKRILKAEEICSITSELSLEQKRALTDPKLKGRGSRDSYRLFLMTSAGARGISLPLATSIMVKVPRFSIETALMEIIQVIYRGRGGYIDGQGNFASGDDLPRRLIFCIDDYVRTYDDGKISELQWARQKIDVVTVLSILRGAIMTRISGYARSRGFDGAIVPVGSTGVANSSDTLSGNFLKLKIACDDLRRRTDDEVKKIASEVIKGIGEFCRSVHLNWNIQNKPENSSSSFYTTKVAEWVTDAPLNDLGQYLYYPNRALVPSDKETDSLRLIMNIPEHVYFIGPLMYLDMQGGDEEKDIATELFRFRGETGAGPGADKLRRACDGLIRVLQERHKNKEERDTKFYAEICRNFLKRDSHRIIGQEFKTQKTINSKGLWVVMPSDWTRFLKAVRNDIDPSDLREDKLRRHAEWQSILLIAMSGKVGLQWYTPFEPFYEHQPFVVAALPEPPTGLERAFDSRYLASTAEFNMLNVILCGG